jgi:protease II
LFYSTSLKLRGYSTNKDDHTLENDDRTKPIYLAALTANNSPGETWGPRRKADQIGVYAHLRNRSTNNNMSSAQDILYYSPTSTNGRDTITSITNPTFNRDSVVSNYDELYEQNRF